MNATCAAGTLAMLLATSGTLAQQRTVAMTAESTSIMANPRVFLGTRDPWTGQGDVLSTRAADTTAAAPEWSAADLLNARLPATRTVLSADASGQGFMLDWRQLSTSHRTLLATYGLSETHLDYLRGDRSQASTPSGMLMRASRLGEIVNSNLWLMRSPTTGSASGASFVYVGTGDGMVHGFDATTGVEALAYVPRGLLPRLAARISGVDPLAHAVDGPVFAANVPAGTDSPRRTVLVGALGAGGKGYYVLDVSDPAQLAVSDSASVVLVDLTASSDPDIGHIHAPPVVEGDPANRTRQIVRLNDRRWAVVMGNGYASARGRPALLIQYLDGARELERISPCIDDQTCAFGGANGLSAPQLVDLNGDGMVDVAYAGDLQGQLWKFDLSANPSAGGTWRVGFAGMPFFTAHGPDGKRQPITTAPHWMRHPHGGLMLAIGTGRHLHAADTDDAAVQSIYGLHDSSTVALGASGVTITDCAPIPSASIASRTDVLVQQRYSTGHSAGGTTYYEASRAKVVPSGPQSHRGWWIDLPHPGQRVLQNPRAFEGQKLLVHSVRPVPTTDTNVRAARVWAEGDSYLSVLNMLTGHPSAQPAFAPQDATLSPSAIGMATIPSGPTLQSRVSPDTQHLRFPGAERPVVLRTGRTVGARAGWREH